MCVESDRQSMCMFDLFCPIHHGLCLIRWSSMERADASWSDCRCYLCVGSRMFANECVGPRCYDQ